MKKLFGLYVTFCDLWALIGLRRTIFAFIFGLLLAGCVSQREAVYLRVVHRHQVLVFYGNPNTGEITSVQWVDERALPADSFHQPRTSPKKRAPNKKCDDFAADSNGVWPDCRKKE